MINQTAEGMYIVYNSFFSKVLIMLLI